jgi:hypothetical protein
MPVFAKIVMNHARPVLDLPLRIVLLAKLILLLLIRDAISCVLQDSSEMLHYGHALLA